MRSKPAIGGGGCRYVFSSSRITLSLTFPPQERVQRTSKGATIVPYIINTDKTTLTNFSGAKSVYPAYITIGNIPKAVRRKPSSHAYRIFAFLPTVTFNDSNLSENDQRLARARVYHHAMKIVFSTLKEPAKKGIDMVSANGAVRHCHTILAGASMDYPEQALCCCVRYGDCTGCYCDPKALGTFGDSPSRSQKQHLDILKAANESNATSFRAFDAALKEYGISPILTPFWADQPYANIHASMRPDILHQLYQGMVKHLTEWVKRLIGPKDFDHRLQRLPPNANLRIFNHGVSSFSTMSGIEHRQLSKQLVGIMIGAVKPAAIRAARALLDFVYLALYESHSDSTLAYLENALREFHEDKDIFVILNARERKSPSPFVSIVNSSDRTLI